MTFKRVTSSVAGDATHFGGDDVNKFSDYLGGTDIGASETVDIATLTRFRDSKFSLRNPANTFSYIFVPAAIAADRNVTMPLLTAGDTLVTEAFTQTLTNKTFSGGTFSGTIAGTPTYSGAQTIYPNSASPLIIGRDQNSSNFALLFRQDNSAGNPIDMASFQIDVTDFTAASEDSNIRIRTVQAGTLTTNMLIQPTQLHFPGTGTAGVVFSTSGLTGQRVMTFPDATVTLVGISTSQTLTTKTINATDNTITDTSTAAGDILASNGTKFIRKPRGTSLQVLRTNSGGTDIEWAAPAGGEVTLAGSETLTNKTINSSDNSITATSQATGDILANNGTKFVRKAIGTSLQVLRTNSGATDIEWATLTTGASAEQVQKSPFYRRYGELQAGHGVLSTSGLCAGFTMSGTASFPSFDSFEGPTAQYATGTTANSRAGINGGSSGMLPTLCRRMNFTLRIRCKVDATASSRLYLGVISNAAIAASDTPVGTTDSGIIVGWRSTDSNWTSFRNDGSGSAVTADLGVAKDANYHYVTIKADDTTPQFTVQLDTGTINSYTTDIPAQTSPLTIYGVVQNTTTTSRNIIFGQAEVERDGILQ